MNEAAFAQAIVIARETQTTTGYLPAVDDPRLGIEEMGVEGIYTDEPDDMTVGSIRRDGEGILRRGDRIPPRTRAMSGVT